MAKNSTNKTASKSKEGTGSTGTVRHSTLPPDFGETRRERIRRGREILRKVQDRVNEMELRRFNGIPNASQYAATTTRNRYLLEEIRETAQAQKREEEDVRLDVDLARLAASAESFDDPALKDAILSSRLPLTKPSLRTLLKGSDEELEKSIRNLLDEQL